MSSSGAIRIETLADAVGTSVFDEVSTEGALKPIVVIDGLFHSRVRMLPVPISSTPSEQPGLEPQAGLVIVEVGRQAGLQTADGDSPVGFVQRGEEADQRRDRIGQPLPRTSPSAPRGPRSSR